MSSANSTESLQRATRTRLRERLRGTGYAALANVDCEVAGGEIILHGVAPTYYLKQLAQTIARDHPDVSRVQNRLQVSPRQV